ncbi:autoinducer-2 kinase [Sulfurovum sp. bin170]|uniref:autoinducer-2 kinase n=1 Tax=Sulfurovum sp. bin170 TaxID=2695268 RepID=UPI0013DF394E|nr:autoinducer-2 kinase [Sulfurovum sp. bin170]NEW60678.1 autoinducer-2 kinase [Sulfurovum sp. bin170]
MSYLMTIDAGTGSVRAVIFDELGNQRGVGQEEWEHSHEEDVDNSMNFDFRTNWGLVCRCIKRAVAGADIETTDIKAITASSMREGIVLYDKFGHELWGVANVDARAFKEVRELKENFVGIEEQFYQESGQTFALGALPRLLWIKNNRPEIYEKIDKISMISDWILAKLSGVIATEPSNAGTTGIFSLKNRDWASHQAQKVGLKSDIFPKVYEPSEPIGEVTVQASMHSGLEQGTLVVMGGGDVQLGSAGLGVVNRGEMAILGGSFWQQVVNIDSSVTPPLDMGIRLNPHVIAGLSQAEGITFFSGLVMRWFRDAFCDMEKIEAKKRGKDVYAILEEKAKKIPLGSHGIMPIFSDVMKYGKWYHASPSFINLSIDPNICNRASMFRSLEENACIVSAINLENISKFSGVYSDTITFAGGASKGALWSQILADVTGKSVKIPVVKEATALGGAMLAGVATGLYGSVAEASKEIVKWEKEIEPDMQNHQKYAEIKEKWQKIYQAQLSLVDRGLTTSMWKAPGV